MITVTGVEEIDAVFREMPRALTHKVMSSAAADAAKPLVEKEKLLAPEGPSGKLIDSIGVIKRSASIARELGAVSVGPRRSSRYKGHYAHLVEEGTRKRVLLGRGKYKAGTNRGIMPARGFVEPAYNQTKSVILERYNTSVGKVLLRTMKKYIK